MTVSLCHSPNRTSGFLAPASELLSRAHKFQAAGKQVKSKRAGSVDLAYGKGEVL